MNKLDLLPDGEFKIDLGEGKMILGKLGTWANKRMCDKFGVKTYMEAIGRIQQFAIEDIAYFLFSAVEYKYRKSLDTISYTLDDAYEWIDAIGGMFGENMGKLITHSSVTAGLKNVDTVDSEDDKKKLSNGTIYSEPITQAE